MPTEFAKIDYNGSVIEYSESQNIWTVMFEGASVAKRASLALAKKAFDDIKNREGKTAFSRHLALLVDGWSSDVKEVNVTSYVEEEPAAWVTTKEGGLRSKQSFSALREHTPDNLELVRRMVVLEEQIEVLHQRVKKLKAQLTLYKQH